MFYTTIRRLQHWKTIFFLLVNLIYQFNGLDVHANTKEKLLGHSYAINVCNIENSCYIVQRNTPIMVMHTATYVHHINQHTGSCWILQIYENSVAIKCCWIFQIIGSSIFSVCNMAVFLIAYFGSPFYKVKWINKISVAA